MKEREQKKNKKKVRFTKRQEPREETVTKRQINRKREVAYVSYKKAKLVRKKPNLSLTIIKTKLINLFIDIATLNAI